MQIPFTVTVVNGSCPHWLATNLQLLYLSQRFSVHNIVMDCIQYPASNNALNCCLHLLSWKHFYWAVTTQWTMQACHSIELNVCISFGRNSVFKGLTVQTLTLDHAHHRRDIWKQTNRHASQHQRRLTNLLIIRYVTANWFAWAGSSLNRWISFLWMCTAVWYWPVTHIL